MSDVRNVEQVAGVNERLKHTATKNDVTGPEALVRHTRTWWNDGDCRRRYGNPQAALLS